MGYQGHRIEDRFQGSNQQRTPLYCDLESVLLAS